MMKKFFLIVIIVTLASSCYCNSQESNKKKISTVSNVSTSAKVGSVDDASGEMTVKREHVKRTYGSYDPDMGFTPNIDATIDMPVGNSKLALSVKKWIANYLLTRIWTFDNVNVDKVPKNSAATIVQSYISQCKKTDGVDGELEISITKEYETSKLVTFKVEGGLSFGRGGDPFIGGATFRKSDGKIMGKSLVNNSPALMELVLEAIAGDSDELFSTFTYKPENMPMPDDGPCVVKDGILFLYASYEISTCRGYMEQIIPIKTIYPYLTEEGKELLK